MISSVLFLNCTKKAKNFVKIQIESKFIHIFVFLEIHVRIDLELITTLSGRNGEGQVDTAKDVVWAGLAVEQSLSFIVTLKKVLKILENFILRCVNFL